MIYIIYENKWICQKIIEDWKHYNPDLWTNDIKKATKFWLFNHYLYKKIPKCELPIITTIHHLEENKIDKDEFKKIETITTYFHSISPKTTEILRKYTKKEIKECCMPLGGEIYMMNNKDELRRKYGLDNYFLIGSFQRDTENSSVGKNPIPKLEKGPDIFMQILLKYFNKNNICVVLTGYNRQYIINELDKNKIKYFYKENVDYDELNILYNILDLYIVSSRNEGGPRSIFDCALTKTPILSTDVGIASLILSKKSIYKDVEDFGNSEPDIFEGYKNVCKYLAPVYIIEFNKKIGFI